MEAFLIIDFCFVELVFETEVCETKFFFIGFSMLVALALSSEAALLI